MYKLAIKTATSDRHRFILKDGLMVDDTCIFNMKRYRHDNAHAALYAASRVKSNNPNSSVLVYMSGKPTYKIDRSWCRATIVDDQAAPIEWLLSNNYISMIEGGRI